jgi:beta-N-acetylhexosaminidase
VKALVEKKAIAGVFITDHNVRGRRAADVKADVDALQAVRKEQGLPPLIIAADQEGGQVSRLSPPLKRQPSLAYILKTLDNDEARRAAVEAYAETQAAELKRIGVTLNFAPVVDLNLDPKNRSDGETHLRLRAIAADPYLVSKVASWYCDVFAKHGLMCTLKHFPGLGRVKRDTHRVSGEVVASEGQLELNDWVPFRRVMSKSNVATMLGHVRVAVIDKTTPASFSHTIISTLIRDTWKHDGLLITDDLSMGAVTRSKAGVGGAAVKALDAGADIVLVSYSEKHLDTVMSALIAADAKGEIDAEARGKSETRLARILKENISSD